MVGERRTRPVTTGGLKRGAAIPRLEVEGDPDHGAPPVSLWRKKKKGGDSAGPAVEASWAAAGRKRVHRERPLAWELRGLKEERCWAG
jgi:hypothetical protein